ncbi:MAG: PilN domain-containing protein [Candidatus Saccharimonadales bacterium]
MIQFNLLPDVKQVYIKTQRIKRFVIGGSLVISAAAIFIFLVLLFSVYIVQKGNISNLNSTIQTDSNTLKNTPNLSTMLTVQSHLNSLPTLDSQDPAVSRLFGFISQLTPTQATISDLQVDFTQNTTTISGNAPNLEVVNTYVDNLKFTSYTVNGQSSSQNAFSSVVLSSFTLNPTSATYSITLSFDPTIFNNANSVTLNVGGAQPQTAAQQPSIIFSKGN